MNSDVLIIGAGTAGLTAAYELLKRGIQPQIIDVAEEVGSSWRRRHDQLHLNTYRPYSSLPGAPLPRRYGVYVRRDDFKVQGQLDASWSEWFDGFSVAPRNDNVTALVGPIEDQPALYGLIARIGGLGLLLLSVQRLGDEEMEGEYGLD